MPFTPATWFVAQGESGENLASANNRATLEAVDQWLQLPFPRPAPTTDIIIRCRDMRKERLDEIHVHPPQKAPIQLEQHPYFMSEEDLSAFLMPCLSMDEDNPGVFAFEVVIPLAIRTRRRFSAIKVKGWMLAHLATSARALPPTVSLTAATPDQLVYVSLLETRSSRAIDTFLAQNPVVLDSAQVISYLLPEHLSGHLCPITAEMTDPQEEVIDLFSDKAQAKHMLPGMNSTLAGIIRHVCLRMNESKGKLSSFCARFVNLRAIEYAGYDRCDSCGVWTNTPPTSGQTYCVDCRGEFVSACLVCSKECLNEEMQNIYPRGRACRSCGEDMCHCHNCGILVRDEDVVERDEGGDGECPRCAERDDGHRRVVNLHNVPYIKGIDVLAKTSIEYNPLRWKTDSNIEKLVQMLARDFVGADTEATSAIAAGETTRGIHIALNHALGPHTSIRQALEANHQPWIDLVATSAKHLPADGSTRSVEWLANHLLARLDSIVREIDPDSPMSPPKAIAKAYRNATGRKLSSKTTGSMGPIFQDKSGAMEVTIIPTRNLTLPPEYYVHSGSCWWGSDSYGSSRNLLLAAGGFCIVAWKGAANRNDWTKQKIYPNARWMVLPIRAIGPDRIMFTYKGPDLTGVEPPHSFLVFNLYVDSLASGWSVTTAAELTILHMSACGYAGQWEQIGGFPVETDQNGFYVNSNPSKTNYSCSLITTSQEVAREMRGAGRTVTITTRGPKASREACLAARKAHPSPTSERKE